MFVSEPGGGIVVISDATNRVVATIPMSGSSCTGMGYDSGQNEIFAICGSSLLSVISDTSNTVVKNLNLTAYSLFERSPVWFLTGLTYDAAKGEIFVAESNSTIYVMSDTSYAITASVAVGYGMATELLAYDSGKGEIFVSNSAKNTLSVISDSTNKVVANMTFGRDPEELAYDAAKGLVFVADTVSGNFFLLPGAGNTYQASGNVSVISDSTNTVIASLPAGDNPLGVAFDSGKGEAFVTNPPDNNVTVISDSSITSPATSSISSSSTSAVISSSSTSSSSVSSTSSPIVSSSSSTSSSSASSSATSLSFSYLAILVAVAAVVVILAFVLVVTKRKETRKASETS